MSVPSLPSGSQPSSVWRELSELLASMRFAIALLTVICIASVIGTVVLQREPLTNYVNQFGPFWARFFGLADLYTVYSAGWFLLILAFLVVSTSLCIARNAPKILTDLREAKEGLRLAALKAFPHRLEGTLEGTPAERLPEVEALLRARGWRLKLDRRPAQAGHAEGVMVAARQGAANKLGYLAAHSAIVLVCIGGLFDGDLIVRAQMALGGKLAYRGDGRLPSVPPEHVLSPANPTYRGQLLVGEGQSTGMAVLNLPDGVVLQPLPFEIQLKKFIVDYYETGMPKLFASEVVIRDKDSGEVREATIKVNHPAEHRGVMIYQSSFEDGGSALHFKAYPLDGGTPFGVEGRVGGETRLKPAGGGAPLGLEFTGLRTINVENLLPSGPAGVEGADVRKVDLVSGLDRHLGSGAQRSKPRTLRNVGPSVTYKLRDEAGQAREFHNYMLPVELDGQRVFLAGVRDSAAENFRYLRLPADEQGGLEGWMRLRRALNSPALREQAAARYAARALGQEATPALRESLSASTGRTLALFAGAEPLADAPAGGGAPASGLFALSAFLEQNVPAADRERTSEVVIRLLNGSLLELLQMARAADGLPPLADGPEAQAFLAQAVTSLSDAGFYPAPVLLQLDRFEQVQASVFQVTRAPGKTLVYLGCLFLIVGVFAMLYIRERRLWIWLEAAEGGQTRVAAALSCTRQTLDTDREFEELRAALLPASKPPETVA